MTHDQSEALTIADRIVGDEPRPGRAGWKPLRSLPRPATPIRGRFPGHDELLMPWSPAPTKWISPEQSSWPATRSGLPPGTAVTLAISRKARLSAASASATRTLLQTRILLRSSSMVPSTGVDFGPHQRRHILPRRLLGERSRRSEAGGRQRSAGHTTAKIFASVSEAAWEWSDRISIERS